MQEVIYPLLAPHICSVYGLEHVEGCRRVHSAAPPEMALYTLAGVATGRQKPPNTLAALGRLPPLCARRVGNHIGMPHELSSTMEP